MSGYCVNTLWLKSNVDEVDELKEGQVFQPQLRYVPDQMRISGLPQTSLGVSNVQKIMGILEISQVGQTVSRRLGSQGCMQEYRRGRVLGLPMKKTLFSRSAAQVLGSIPDVVPVEGKRIWPYVKEAYPIQQEKLIVKKVYKNVKKKIVNYFTSKPNI